MIFLFFFNDTATTEIYPLSLHDALPISRAGAQHDVVLAHGKWLVEDFQQMAAFVLHLLRRAVMQPQHGELVADRKSTRLNSSHQIISYAVFCLKKKKNNQSSTHSTSTHI